MKKYIKGSQQTRWPSWPHARRDLLEDNIFVFYMRTGIGIEDTPYVTFGVESKDIADDWVVRISLNKSWSTDYGQPNCDKLLGAEVNYGIPGQKPGTIKDFCDVLLHAQEVCDDINSRLEYFNSAASEWFDELISLNQPEEI